MEKAKTSKEIRDITDMFKETVNDVSSEILDESGSWNYELLDDLRRESAELRSEVRENIYGESLVKSMKMLEKLLLNCQPSRQKAE